MRVLKAKQVFEIEGYIYRVDRNNKKLSVGTILYDSRKDDFILLNKEQDVFDYNFVAPELYAVLELIAEF